MAILENLKILFIGTEKNGNYLGIQLFVLHLFVLLMREHLQEFKLCQMYENQIKQILKS